MAKIETDCVRSSVFPRFKIGSEIVEILQNQETDFNHLVKAN